MRFSIPLILLAASLISDDAGITNCNGQESLFSQIAMESVYESDKVASLDLAAKHDDRIFERITGASSLVPALEAAGFKPRRDRDSVTAEVDYAGWKLPIRMRVEIDKDRIGCEMPLVTLKDAAAVAPETLLDLLARGDVADGMFFAYESEKKVIQLRMSLVNRGITAAGLKADLVKFAAFAETHADIWSKLGKPMTARTAQSAAGAGASTTKTATPPSAKLSLVGRWGATLANGESFAILIGADARFKLVHVKGDKSSVSEGKATRSGNRLSLVGDDKVTITGKLTQTTADRFQLAILDAKGNPTKLTLNFVKAK